MRNVLIFTDIGVDDTFALLYAFNHPDIRVVGVVAGFGNVSKEKVTRNAYYVLKQMNKENIPLISGAARSFSGDEPTYYEEIHGLSGLGNIQTEIEKFTLSNFDKVFEIIDEIEDLVIVNMGRLTSLAMAYITSPERMKKIARVVIMGGAFLVPGNVTPYAEANFFGDPVAANVVLDNTGPNKIVLIPLNVSKKGIITPSLVESIQSESITEIGSLIGQLYEPYYDFYKKQKPSLNGAPMHDLLTIVYVTNPSLFKSVKRNVTVEESSYLTTGVSVADFRDQPQVNEDFNNYCEILLDIDYPAFITEVATTMIGKI
ncbi:nucleoside hydrolase [Pontibacillus salipaludis]|uniref:Nucleoside hydrolase n=1 Tax=Pontibacillus salipaludis TaxID=1697394 RepID=A0ABQ1Q488_9BACI|nr:nucleoside hydrolase [Pontibacillus salipaludis]GGD12306.1 nucleoside hydrolase [Pontibacillus salipaludis]